MVPARQTPATGVAAARADWATETVRSGSIYGAGMAALLPLGFLSLAVSTRYLDLADYGRTATLFAVVGALTLLAGLAVLQGTLMVAYRAADDGADGADAVSSADVDTLDPQEGLDVSADERRRLLGSGLLLGALMAAIVGGGLALLAGPLATGVLGGADWASVVRWAGLCVFSGSLWRLAHQIWRLERRPVYWLSFQVMRPLLAIAGTLVAFVAGAGIDSPFLATAGATLVTLAVSLALSRPMILVRPRRGDAGIILRAGSPMVPIILASVVQSHSAIFLLAAIAPAASVGIYQVAARIAQIPSFFADGFFLAWLPTDNSPVGWASQQRQGIPRHLSGVFTLLFIATLAILVVVSLAANSLVLVASSDYKAAADLIPLLAAGAVGHSLFRGVYRATRFKQRRNWYVALHFIWLVPYLAVAAGLQSLGATWAVAAALIAGNLVVAAWMVVLDRRYSRSPTPFQFARLGTAALVAAGLVVVVSEAPLSDAVRTSLAVVATVAFPLLLVATGVITAWHLRTIRSLLGGLLPMRWQGTRVRRQVPGLPQRERDAVVALLWRGESAAAAGRRLGVGEAVLLARLVRGMRRLDGDTTVTPYDAEIGSYLLHDGPAIVRDDLARRMAAAGLDPLDLHRVGLRAAVLRSGRPAGERRPRRLGVRRRISA